jgi:hypothetical protein
MKVHIYHHGAEEQPDAVNICLDAVPDGVEALNELVDNAEAIQIILEEALDYVPLTKLADFLETTVRKLRHGGTLIVVGTDALAVAKDFSQYKIPIEEFNVMLHGGEQGPHQVKTATLTMHGVVNFLRNEYGLKILRQTIDDYTYVVEAQRP